MAAEKNIIPNPDGIRGTFEEVARKIELIDLGIRQKSEGRSVSEVRDLAAERFEAAGVTLPGAALYEYAQHVVDDKPFEFRLQ